ncbi:MAG: hypothetical protein ACM3WP_22635 [Acidobacteriota bacterium]
MLLDLRSVGISGVIVPKPEQPADDSSLSRPSHSVVSDEGQRGVWRPGPRKLWTFLNSAFGLFVLSSIVLASLSFGYHQWTKSQEREIRIEQLDIEISLRLQDMKALAQLPDRNRYDNIGNVQRIDQGDTTKFFNRRPAFPEYKDKNTTSLMWQLYVLLPNNSRPEVQRAVQESIRIDRLIPQIRFKAASAVDIAPAKSKRDQQQQNEDANILKTEFGQTELFSRVLQLADIPRWKNFPAND